MRPTLCLLASLLACGPLLAQAQPSADDGWPESDRLLATYARDRDPRPLWRRAPALLREDPTHDDLRTALADSYLAAGHTWDAAIEYQYLVDHGAAAVKPHARLYLAHALSWTGRMPRAEPHYQALLDGPLAPDSRLGLANALRWQGRQDLAMPHYRQSVIEQPHNPVATDGALFSERALRARTVVGFTVLKDNSPMRRQELQWLHQWRNEGGYRIFSVEGVGARDENPALHRPQRELTVRAEDLNLPGAPRVELTQQTLPRSSTFGQLRLRASDSPLYVNIGRVNWGKMAFNVHALDEGLTAQRIGLEGKYPSALGEWRGYANRFGISDGNRVDNGDIRLTPWWRPWGSEVRFYAGTAWRRSARNDPRYWSPNRYAAAYVGIEGEWERPGWSLLASGYLGTPLTNDAARYWAATLSAKKWLNRDWALGVNAWAQSNSQGAQYRSHGLGVLVEKLW